MSNPLTKVELDVSEEELAELAALDADTVGQHIMDKLTDYTLSLEALGLNPEILMAALLQVYCDVASDYGDRDTYEEQLNVALEDEWPEQWIH